MSATSRPIGDVPMRSIYPNYPSPDLTETTAPEASEQAVLADVESTKPANKQGPITGWLLGLVALFVILVVLNIKV